MTRYVIRDQQFDCRYFADKAFFKTKNDIIEQLVDYHSIDYIGVRDDDTEYYDIWEFINGLKNNAKRLAWVLEYGQWEIEKVKVFLCRECKEIYEIDYYASDEKHTICRDCEKEKINA